MRKLEIDRIVPLLIIIIEGVLFSNITFNECLHRDLPSALSVVLLILYYYFLWQFDHGVAPLVWEHKDDRWIDGWIFGKIEITDYYNICMLFLLFTPPLIYFTLTLG